MADQLDDLKKKIEDLNKRIAALGGSFFKDVDKAIASFGGGIKGAEEALKSLRKEFDNLNTDTNYFYDMLKRVTAELKGQNSFTKDITKSYSKLSSIANQLKYDQDGISELSKKELERIIKKIDIQRAELSNTLRLNLEQEEAAANRIRALKAEEESMTRIAQRRGYTLSQEYDRLGEIGNALDKEEKLLNKIIEANQEAAGLLGDQEVSLRTFEKLAESRLREEKNIAKTLGITGKIVDGIVGTLGKLGISSEFFEKILRKYCEDNLSKYPDIIVGTSVLYQKIN